MLILSRLPSYVIKILHNYGINFTYFPDGRFRFARDFAALYLLGFIPARLVSAQLCTCLALRLLMLRVLANYHDFSVSLDDLALFADRFYGRSYLHLSASFAYLSRHVILPLDRSYGDNSTFTLSPGRILIKFILIFPEI